MVMTNGVGAVFGSLTSGFLIEHFFTAADGSKDWHGIWVTFALYALVMAMVFVPLFKHKHDPDAMRRAQQRPEGELVRSEEHTSELQSLMRISYAVFCLKKKKKK